MATEARSTTAMAWPSLLLIILSALATVITHVDGATGGVAAPAPAVDCTDALLSLAGCLSYVQEGSTVATPDASCCSGLKDVVKKEVACLCQAFQGSQDYGVTLNMTKALQLPDACKVKTPPFSKCHRKFVLFFPKSLIDHASVMICLPDGILMISLLR